MTSTASVSKGCFPFNPKCGPKKANSRTKDPLDELDDEVWYRAFKKLWKKIEEKIEGLEDSVTEKLLSDIVSFISFSSFISARVPAATLLTGVNLPDHGYLFLQLKEKLKKDVTPYIAILTAKECPSVRLCVEQTVGQLMRHQFISPQMKKTFGSDDEDLDESEDEEEMEVNRLKRSDLTMSTLLDWYTKPFSPSPKKKPKTESPRKRLVVIISEFEAFPANVLKDFILILSGYAAKLPIVIVFGVATSLSALNDSLPHRVTSRLSIQIFQSQPSVYFLNNTLEKVFLNSDCPFQLGPKIFKFLTDVFLFYDFSVQGFTRGIKYCLMEHFYEKPFSLLCCQENEAELKKALSNMSHEKEKGLLLLDSFREYVESQPKSEQTSMLSSDTQLKKAAVTCIMRLKKKIFQFHIALRLLKILVCELPSSPLGKQVREFYLLAVSDHLIHSPQYKECCQLLGFQAKDELISKLDKMISYLKELGEKETWVKEVKSKLTSAKEKVSNAGVNKLTQSPTKSPRKLDLDVKNRSQLKERLAQMSKMEKQETDYEVSRRETMDYLMNNLFPSSLSSFVKLPFHEVFVCDNASAVKRRIVGVPRAALHQALNNPHVYLQCKCCGLEHPTEIKGTMPDICIVYKLHLESGTLINMYDWLMAFVTIVEPESVLEDKKNISPKLQARFSQAVAELEFLGFIKSSKRKTDHVARLTWGGSSS